MLRFSHDDQGEWIGRVIFQESIDLVEISRIEEDEKEVSAQ